ncbi:O-methyltransferase [Bacteroidota bacterium]
MFQTLRSCFLFWKNSSNEHGVHSPFVFDLVTKCFYNKSKSGYFSFYKEVLHCINELKKTDNNSNFSKKSKEIKGCRCEELKQITSVKKKNVLLLMRLTQYLKVESILELGTSCGKITTCLAKVNPNAKIDTIESCIESARLAKSQFKNFKLNNVNLVVGEFSENLPDIIKEKKYDFIYFNNRHHKKLILSYFYLCLASVHNDTVFVINGIHRSKETESAWEEIKLDRKVKVTIDTFHFGMVFFRREQVKEHFVIRV